MDNHVIGPVESLLPGNQDISERRCAHEKDDDKKKEIPEENLIHIYSHIYMIYGHSIKTTLEETRNEKGPDRPFSFSEQMKNLHGWRLSFQSVDNGRNKKQDDKDNENNLGYFH
jgi:hypothetical protein